MSGKVCVMFSGCASCSGLTNEDIGVMRSSLLSHPKITSVLNVGPVCMKETLKELKETSLEGCDRVVIGLWCPPELLGLTDFRILPKSINRNLVDLVDLSVFSSGDRAKKNIDRQVRALLISASKLYLAEPLKDRYVKYESSNVAVLGSDDRAVRAARELSFFGVKTTLLLSPQANISNVSGDMEHFDNVSLESLSGHPGNFQLTFDSNDSRRTINAAALLIVSARSSISVKASASTRFKFIPLEQFGDYTGSAERVNGMVFMDQLRSLDPSATPVLPSWHILLESAKNATVNGLADTVTVVARDIKASGLLEFLWKEAAEAGVKFVRYSDKSRPRMEKGEKFMMVKDLVLGENLRLPADVIVSPTISHPWEPVLIEKLMMPSDWNFRVRSRGPQRGIAQSACDAIFLLGYSDYNIPSEREEPELSSVLAEVLLFLHRGAHHVHGEIAVVRNEKCSGCNTCVRTCPYRAAVMDKSMKAVVIEEKCAGCGNCVAVCPNIAIELKNCTGEQIQAQLSASLGEVDI